jgi:putative long chain acyl-CoA synthase
MPTRPRASSLKRAPRRLRRWAKASVANAVELVRLGRLTQQSGEPFEVVDKTAICRLRRYGSAETRLDLEPLLLVPPLMLTAEIYDVSPDLSAVARLVEAGLDPWVVDFGAPEEELGGMNRTLDDHVRGVAWAVERIADHTGRDCHLAGYSQGGMFAYQAAALLGSKHVASLITFGSPVDIHKNLPTLASDVAAHAIRGLEPLVRMPLEHIEGLPGVLTSTAFKLLTPRKELAQLVDFLSKLHDRAELERRESRRRFLGGEGFVAWPGPALIRFFDEFIVHNRMVSGGFVIDGRTLTLADIRCPILYFVGARDDVARPPSIRAIRDVAPEAEAHEIVLRAGHFGLVVGSTALRDTWPAVVEWVRWRAGSGPEPTLLAAQRPLPPLHDEPEELFEIEVDYDLLGDELVAVARQTWRRLGDRFRDAGDTVYALRNQLPRVWKLETMNAATKVSPSRALAEQARRRPDATFFLWKGRAFSYRDADSRVTNVARGLIASGVGPGDRVGVLMGVRPSHLSLVTALGRIGAVAVLVSPAIDDAAIAKVLADEGARFLGADPDHAARARGIHDHVLVLGGGPDRNVVDGVIDMEAIDPAAVAWPETLEIDPGTARDLALVLVRPGPGGSAKRSRISNGRWAFSALGVSSATTLAPEDTVYCCLPLHHPTGIMVAVGGALVAGARLALATGFDATAFWGDARRYGATVVFYAGEMVRALVEGPPRRSDRSHAVRLFAGSGMRGDVWLAARERFGVGVIEFYASTERNLVLTNAAGAKIGALGRPMPGSVDVALVAYDYDREALREVGGRLVRCDADEPGVALARVSADAPGPFSGPSVEPTGRVLRDVFTPGDAWFDTQDVLRRDADGDYWFVDRLSNVVRTARGPVATPRVEDALYAAGASLAVAHGVRVGAAEEVRASVVAPHLDPRRFAAAVRFLAEHERPTQIDRVASIPTTEGMRPIKASFRETGPREVIDRLVWQEGGYRALHDMPRSGSDLPPAAPPADTRGTVDDPGAAFLSELGHGELEALVETMFLVAFADGHIGEAERAHFEHSVADLSGGRVHSEQFEHVVAQVRDRLEREGRDACIQAIEQRLATPELRQVALILAGDMAAADGTLHDAEREIIVSLAKAFGMSDDVTREVLDGPLHGPLADRPSYRALLDRDASM